jgi:hypothetical protein
MSIDGPGATLTAAVVAAVASILTLGVRLGADARAEMRQANRSRLVPLLADIGDSLHKLVACSVLAVRDTDTSNRSYYDGKKREARDSLRKLRAQLRYQLWGLDDGFKTLIALPDWIDARGIADYDRLLKSASELRLALDLAILSAYRTGMPPSLFSRVRVRWYARRMWNTWTGLRDAIERDNQRVSADKAVYPKIQAMIVRREGELITARTDTGADVTLRASHRTGKGSRTLAQPGVQISLYRRPGDDFWRYRFSGAPAGRDESRPESTPEPPLTLNP